LAQVLGTDYSTFFLQVWAQVLGTNYSTFFTGLGTDSHRIACLNLRCKIRQKLSDGYAFKSQFIWDSLVGHLSMT
jgi:hypothetical protein